MSKDINLDEKELLAYSKYSYILKEKLKRANIYQRQFCRSHLRFDNGIRIDSGSPTIEDQRV